MLSKYFRLRRLAMTPRRLFSASLCVALLACTPTESRIQDVVEVVVFPQQVDMTVSDTQRFVAYGVTEAGDSVAASVNWSATAGQIAADGMYTTADTAGSSFVIATLALRSSLKDSATVNVTDPGVKRVVTAVEVTPSSVVLSAGATQPFEARARDQFGGVMSGTFSWSATGGTVTSGGFYEAGSATGSFVVAAQEVSGLADTANITLVEPVLTTVEVSPASVSLRPGQTRQFAAVARDQSGAAMQGTFSWTASGGSITSDGFYTAGTTLGSYEVVATESSGLADTAAVSISEQAGAFPNEPAGLSVLGEHSFPAGYFENFAGSATYTAPGAAWVMRDYELRLHIETDIADAPMSPPGTMGMAYPAGMPTSGEPASFEFHVPEQRELYVSYHFLIPSNPNNGMWEMEPAGVKFLGYISYGDDQQQNEGTFMFKPGGLQAGPLFAETAYAGRPGSCPLYANEANAENITLDEWHQLEVYGKLNDMGVANGIHRVWIDGELYSECDQMSYISSPYPHGFWQIHFQPVWGGNNPGVVKLQDDYAYLDHIYISGVEK
jgi:hypothetical protein